MPVRRIGIWIVLTLLVGLSALPRPTRAGPSGSGLNTVAEIANYKGADRQERFEVGARAEGAIMIYTSMELEESQPILEAFQKKYPFIHGEIYRATGEDVAQKIITEYRGRKYVADIDEGTGTDVVKLFREGFAQSFFTPRAGTYPRQGQGPQGVLGGHALQHARRRVEYQRGL